MSTIGDLPPDGGYDITCPNCGTVTPLVWSATPDGDETVFDLDDTAIQQHRTKCPA